MPTLAAATSPDPAGPVERIGRIAALIETSGAPNEANGQLVPAVVDALFEQRLFRMLLPRAYDGEEIDPVTWFAAMEALGKLDASTAWCVGQLNGCSATASALDPAIARKIWGEPRAALGWGPPVRSRADEVDGGHRLSGEWMMASGSRHATWVGMMAPAFDPTGAPVALPEGSYMRVFYTPARDIEWIDNWDVVGLNATNSGGFKANDVFVPHGHSITLPHQLKVQLAAPLYKFPLNILFAIGFSAVALGIARAMLTATVALATEKTPRMAKLSLIDNHMVQFQIGAAEARLRSARSYVETTVERVWQAMAASGELTVPQRLDMRMATTFAIHEANAVADVAWEVAGAHAIFASGPLERRMRDIRTLTQQIQGRKTHLQEVGAWLLGLPPNLAYA